MLSMLNLSPPRLEDEYPEEANILADLCMERHEAKTKAKAKGKRIKPLYLNKPAPIRVLSKIGRNEPCSCGSGKKYKKCCIMG